MASEPDSATDAAPQEATRSLRRGFRRIWPWLVIGLVAVPAFWHVVDFPADLDPEYPVVERPTFSRRPPPAYRLAEPGDTIDRIAIYLSSAALVLSLAGLIRADGDRRLWLTATAISTAALWHSATPGPTFDGWHGLGWRAVLNEASPGLLRLVLLAGAAGLAALAVGPLLAARHDWKRLWHDAGAIGVRGLLVAALIFVSLRQFELPGVEPLGYWPRWLFVFGLVALDLALFRLTPPAPRTPHRWLRRGLTLSISACAWFTLVVGGIWVTWYHRPLDRLRTVVPGRIYISAMPTERGLEVAQRRHHFKTIINLFPENTPQRSPRLPQELRFVERHNIRYIGSPSADSESNAFLDLTLAVAQDPSAWPILVHCHGCMDRSPAWMGIYRFVVQGRPLEEILQEIERHRGYRPKASVTLLYNRVLPTRAPEHYANDPTASLLVRCAHGCRELSTDLAPRSGAGANHVALPAVSDRGRPPGRPANLTQPGRSLDYLKADRPTPLQPSANPS